LVLFFPGERKEEKISRLRLVNLGPGEMEIYDIVGRYRQTYNTPGVNLSRWVEEKRKRKKLFWPDGWALS
jgi:hypothetical protein